MLREAKEKIFLCGIATMTALTVLPLFHIIYSVASMGLPVLLRGGLEFLTGTLPPPGEELGGIGPAILGTFILTFLAALIGLPIAVMAGVYAAEYPDSILGRLTRTLLTIMMEFPTILVGLFVMQILVIPMGSYSAIAGAVALAIIMMPYVAVYTEEAFRNIPSTYREAAFSLGLTRFKVVFRVLSGMARKGIVTGMLIGIAKVAGETAPLIHSRRCEQGLLCRYRQTDWSHTPPDIQPRPAALRELPRNCLGSLAHTPSNIFSDISAAET